MEGYIHQFLYTYRFVCTPEQLLQFIMDKFISAARYCISSSSMHRDTKMCSAVHYANRSHENLQPSLSCKLQNILHLLFVFHTRQGPDMSGDNEKIFHRSLDVLHFWITDCRLVDFMPKSGLVDTLENFLNTEVTMRFALRSTDTTWLYCDIQYLSSWRWLFLLLLLAHFAVC